MFATSPAPRWRRDFVSATRVKSATLAAQAEVLTVFDLDHVDPADAAEAMQALFASGQSAPTSGQSVAEPIQDAGGSAGGDGGDIVCANGGEPNQELALGAATWHVFAHLDRAMHQFGGVFEVEFFLDVGPVGLNGLDAEVKLFGDLAGAAALADEAENFEFTVAKALHERTGPAGAAAGQLVHELAAHFLAQVNAAAEDLANRAENGFGRFGFHDVAGSAGPEGALRIKGFIVHGKHEQRDFGVVGLDILDQFQAAAAFEGKVDDGDIRIEFGDSLEGRGRVLELAAD